MPAPPIITLLSDFGTADAYVAAMKGVILGICRDAALVDITHAIPPQDIAAGAYELAACGDAKVRIWDWRIGKELLALSDAAHTVHVAAHPDGLTIAYSGWAPSLRIAKALPWNKLTRRDGDFYHAVDDLWTYTAQLSPAWKVPLAERGGPVSPIFAKPDQALLADEAETLGDIQRHRGQPTKAIEHYTRAIEIRKKLSTKSGRVLPRHTRTHRAPRRTARCRPDPRAPGSRADRRDNRPGR